MFKRNRLLSMVICVVLALVTALSMVGCGPRDEGEKIDKTKTQLYIAAYGGGYGTAYLEDLKTRFEEYTKDMKFEPGTTGVQVIIRPDQEKYTATNMKTQLAYDNNEVFYLSGSELSSFVQDGMLTDITDVVKADLSEFGEPGVTIESKLSQNYKDYLMRDGKYYELPFVDTSLGVVYSAEVFKEQGLYIAKGGSPSERLIAHYDNYIASGGDADAYVMPDINTLWDYDEEDGDYYVFTKTGEKSAGPDGDYSTEYDNGLPATIEDFEAFLERCQKTTTDAIIWTGQYEDTYSAFLPRSFYVNYHGVDEAGILNTAGGEGVETRVIESFANGQPVITKTSISASKDNLDKLAKQAGHYYALDLLNKILDSGKVSNLTWQGYSNTRTQAEFIISNKFGNTPIALMIEGSWWESEADSAGIYKDYAADFTKKSRDFGFLPMPEATHDDYLLRVKGEKKGTIIGDGASLFIKSGLSEIKTNLAKLFLKFSLTEESLRRFTVKTSMPAPYSYELKSEDYADMTPFAKSYIQLYLASDRLPAYAFDQAKNSAKIEAISSSLNYYKAMKPNNGGDYELVVTELYQKETTARQYFEGMYHRVLFDLGMDK